MQIIDLFQNYRANKARLALLNERGAGIRQEIARLKESILEDHQHITSSMDSLPHGAGIGNPTQSIAVMMADGTTSEIQQQEKKLRKITQEAVFLNRLIRYAEILLEALTDKERFVIQNHMIDGKTWEETTAEFGEKFTIPITVDGLRKMQRRAVNRLRGFYEGDR